MPAASLLALLSWLLLSSPVVSYQEAGPAYQEAGPAYQEAGPGCRPCKLIEEPSHWAGAYYLQVARSEIKGIVPWKNVLLNFGQKLRI